MYKTQTTVNRDYLLLNDFSLWRPLIPESVKQPQAQILEIPPGMVQMLTFLMNELEVSKPSFDAFWVKEVIEFMLKYYVRYVKEFMSENNLAHVFIQTSHSSFKLLRDNTIVVRTKAEIEKTLKELILLSWQNHVPIKSFVVLENIKLFSLFKAFDGLPITTEYRVFVENRSVLSSNFHWPESMFINEKNLPEGWQSQLALMKRVEDIKYLENLAVDVYDSLAHLHNSWAMDFGLGADGEWYLMNVLTGQSAWGYKEGTDE